MLGGIHEDDEAKVCKELCPAVEEWNDIYEKDKELLPSAATAENTTQEIYCQGGVGFTQIFSHRRAPSRRNSKLLLYKSTPRIKCPLRREKPRV